MSMIHVAVLASLLISALTAMLTFLRPNLDANRMLGTKTRMQSHFDQIQACVNEPSAWAVTVSSSDNPILSCLKDGTACGNGLRGPIRVFDSGGNDCLQSDIALLAYNPLNPSHGIKTDGEVCTDYTAAGNPSCPYRVEYEFEATCPTGAASCTYPVETVRVKYSFNPGEGNNSIASANISGSLTETGFSVVRGRDSDILPVVIYETKPASQPGGPCQPGAGIPRKFNFIQSDPGKYVIALDAATGNFTLAPGEYECRFSAPAYAVSEHRAALQTSSGTGLITGSSEFTSSSMSMMVSRSEGVGIFAFNVPTTVALMHYCKDPPTDPAFANLHFGVPTGKGAELYSIISCKVYKRATE